MPPTVSVASLHGTYLMFLVSFSSPGDLLFPPHSKLFYLSISFPGKYPVLSYRVNLEISLP